MNTRDRKMLSDYCLRRDRLMYVQDSRWRRFMRWLAKVMP